MITEDELRAMIVERTEKWGSATTLTHDAGVCHSAVSCAKHGSRIHTDLARHFGYRKVILYEPIE